MEYLLFHCLVSVDESWDKDHAGLMWLLGLFAEFHLDVVSHSHSVRREGDVLRSNYSFLVRYVSGSGVDIDGFFDQFNLYKITHDNVYFLG